MSSKKQVVVSKDALRTLMKQQRNSTQSNAKKIDSPLAKYNNVGQLTCILCNCPVKRDLLWTAHVQGRTHRENVAKLKAPKQDVFTKPALPPPNTLKRKQQTCSSDAVVQKVRKVPTQDTVSTSSLNYVLIGSRSHSHSPDGGSPLNSTAAPSTSLPSDFFDGDQSSGEVAMDTTDSNGPNADEAETSKSTPEPEESKPMAEKLPEGFFDDPKKDAKAREVEYRNKMDDEWELFQRVMKDESTVSEAIEEEEEEQKTTERNIEEIDEQMLLWSQVEELHKAKEQLMLSSEAPRAEEQEQPEEEEEEEEELDEEQEIEEFLDWRTKKAWK